MGSDGCLEYSQNIDISFLEVTDFKKKKKKKEINVKSRNKQKIMNGENFSSYFQIKNVFKYHLFTNITLFLAEIF